MSNPVTRTSKEMDNLVRSFQKRWKKQTKSDISYTKASEIVAKNYKQYVSNRPPVINVNIIKKRRSSIMYDESSIDFI